MSFFSGVSSTVHLFFFVLSFLHSLSTNLLDKTEILD